MGVDDENNRPEEEGRQAPQIPPRTEGTAAFTQTGQAAGTVMAEVWMEAIYPDGTRLRPDVRGEQITMQVSR